MSREAQLGVGVPLARIQQQMPLLFLLFIQSYPVPYLHKRCWRVVLQHCSQQALRREAQLGVGVPLARIQQQMPLLFLLFIQSYPVPYLHKRCWRVVLQHCSQQALSREAQLGVGVPLARIQQQMPLLFLLFIQSYPVPYLHKRCWRVVLQHCSQQALRREAQLGVGVPLARIQQQMPLLFLLFIQSYPVPYLHKRCWRVVLQHCSQQALRREAQLGVGVPLARIQQQMPLLFLLFIQSYPVPYLHKRCWRVVLQHCSQQALRREAQLGVGVPLARIQQQMPLLFLLFIQSYPVPYLHKRCWRVVLQHCSQQALRREAQLGVGVPLARIQQQMPLLFLLFIQSYPVPYLHKRCWRVVLQHCSQQALRREAQLGVGVPLARIQQQMPLLFLLFIQSYPVPYLHKRCWRVVLQHCSQQALRREAQLGVGVPLARIQQQMPLLFLLFIQSYPVPYLHKRCWRVVLQHCSQQALRREAQLGVGVPLARIQQQMPLLFLLFIQSYPVPYLHKRCWRVVLQHCSQQALRREAQLGVGVPLARIQQQMPLLFLLFIQSYPVPYLHKRCWRVVLQHCSQQALRREAQLGVGVPLARIQQQMPLLFLLFIQSYPVPYLHKRCWRVVLQHCSQQALRREAQLGVAMDSLDKVGQKGCV
ncbi:unnamed protein product [Closterium sp. Naga37s-1]|nr:unnamed protein product [Closterium sp. Naga37s-1]